MNTPELMLCMAIKRARLGGADRSSAMHRAEDAKAVMAAWVDVVEDSLFPFTIDDIDRWRLNLRKNRDVQTKVDIAEAHGASCFWRSRGKGPCSIEIHAGHIVADCNGGELTVANGQIECAWHNTQRQAMSIEQYLSARDMNTEGMAASQPGDIDPSSVVRQSGEHFG